MKKRRKQKHSNIILVFAVELYYRHSGKCHIQLSSQSSLPTLQGENTGF